MKANEGAIEGVRNMIEAVHTQNMSRSKLTQDEFQKRCFQHELTPTKACDLVFIRTGAIIKPMNIKKSFYDRGVLSEPMTGLFRLLFKMLDEQRVEAIGTVQ